MLERSFVEEIYVIHEDKRAQGMVMATRYSAISGKGFGGYDKKNSWKPQAGGITGKLENIARFVVNRTGENSMPICVYDGSVSDESRELFRTALSEEIDYLRNS